jgi:hypothetical protein
MQTLVGVKAELNDNIYVFVTTPGGGGEDLCVTTRENP